MTRRLVVTEALRRQLEACAAARRAWMVATPLSAAGEQAREEYQHAARLCTHLIGNAVFGVTAWGAMSGSTALPPDGAAPSTQQQQRPRAVAS